MLMRNIGALALGLCFAAWASGQVHYAPKNIDWGAAAETEVSRETRVPPGARMMGVDPEPETVETRTLTLASGSRIRVRERIETDAQGTESRVFVGGEQLSELSVVAHEETLEDVLTLLRAHGCTVVRRYGRTGCILRVRLPKSDAAATEALLRALAETGTVSAERSQVRFFLPMGQPSATPNDPHYAAQWALSQIGVDKVWAKGFYGYPNIPCAVFDTGVHLTHEDLQENVRRKVSAVNSSPDPEDHHGHGSHCLGIMGADGNNGKGVTGVGQVANLSSIRGPISYWQEGDSILDGFQWALDNGIRVLSCSFGSPPGTASYDASEYAMIEELGKAGCLVVIAAGNDGNDNDRVPGYPSSYDCDNIIAVVCSNAFDRPANGTDNRWFTSYGATSCDIAAPGTDILSCTKAADDSYESWSGTSMATPLVAACAAMVWERNPTWTYRDVRDRLYATATPNAALLGYCSTAARVDLDRAMSAQTEYVACSLEERTYESNGPITLAVTASAGVERVSVTLSARDKPDFSQELGTFPVTPGASTTLAVWTPTDADRGRGYTFKVVAAEDPNAFAYSALFRVKLQGVNDTITVTTPAKDARMDADALSIAFLASDAAYVTLSIEQQTAAGEWEIVSTLGMAVCADSGEEPTPTKLTAQMRGRGWISERPYRVVVTDADDDRVEARSEPFFIDRSTCTVFLLPGNPTGSSETSLELSDDTWAETYRAGEELRVSCWLPETSLYWLLLIDEKENTAAIVKQTWADASSGARRSFRTFAITLPETLTASGPYRLRLVDAFYALMYQDSKVFTVAPRADGKDEPSVAETFGDVSGRAYACNNQWYPEPSGGGWALRSGWIGPGEEAYFETEVAGPAVLRFDARISSPNQHGVFTVAYTAPPALHTSVWTTLTQFSGAHAAAWQNVECSVPAGTHIVRWTYSRDAETDLGGTQNVAWVDNVRFVPEAAAVTIRIDTSATPATASIAGGMAWPGYITYTLDGSDPLPGGPHWVPELNLPLYQSVRIKARAFMEGYEPGEIASARYLLPQGAGTVEDPIRIASAVELQAFAETVTAGTDYAGQTVVLTGDIDFAGAELPAAGWMSRFGETRPFQGTFDGQGHTLIAPTFMATVPDTQGADADAVQGMFGAIGEQGIVRNLTLLRPVIPVPSRSVIAAGSIAAGNEGVVEHCHVYDASLFLANIGEPCRGGLVGFMETQGDGPHGKLLDSSFVGVLHLGDGEPKAHTEGTPGVPPVFLPGPVLSPPPGPIAETVEVIATAEYPIETARDDGMWQPYSGPIVLVHGQTHTLTFRTTDGQGHYSAPVRAVYGSYDKPRCTVPRILFGDGSGTPLPSGITLPPLTHSFCVGAAPGGWFFTYTLDGSEPTEEGPRCTAPILIPGACTIKVRAFCPPWYSPGPTSSVIVNLQREDAYRAHLTVVRGQKLEGVYWSETFRVKADPAPAGQRFSHWLVTGPLTLEFPAAQEISFPWMTKEPLTLEAVFVNAPGYSLRLR